MSDIQWRSEKRLIKDLIPQDYNPRQMTEKQVKALRKSLQKFSVADPIIINTNGNIIGGHQRTRILADLGISEVDVRIPSRQLNDLEEQELNLRLNGNRGSFDVDALANNWDLDFLKEIDFTDFDIEKLVLKEPSLNDDDDYKTTDSEKTEVRIMTFHFIPDQFQKVTSILEKIMKEKQFMSLTESFLFLIDEYEARDKS